MTSMLAIVLAAALGGSAPWAPVTREFTLAPGETITATIFPADSGSTVVIVPGLIGSGYGFRHVIPALAERGHRVIVIDLLGAGRSSKPVKADYTLTAQSRRVEAVLDSLDVRNAVIMAQALGGSIVYRMALRRPDLVRSIVSIDAGATEQAATSGLRKALRFAPLIKLFGAKRMLTGKVKDGLIEGSYDRAWVTPEVVDEYAAPYREDTGHTLRVLRAIADSVEPEALTPRLPELRTPVLLLVGTHPSALSEDKIETMRALPYFRLQRIENAGQFPHEEQPARVVEELLRVIEASEWQ